MINVDNAPGDKMQNIFGWGLLEVVKRSMVKVVNDPGSLTLTHGLQEWMISKSCVSFEEECIYNMFGNYHIVTKAITNHQPEKC